MKHILENLKETDMLFVASHNNDTVDLTKKIMSQDLKLKDGRVRFGQLKAFSD
jgi:hypothetical protein